MAHILALDRITKRYPGIVALDNVHFAVSAGEIRALVGKNGAGKSTLIKILSGAVQPDSGEIRIGGKPVTLREPRDAFRLGICTVYQEMSLVLGLTVAENILLGRWPQQRHFGISTIDRGEIMRVARAALDQLEVKLDLNRLVAELNVTQRQLVEVAKAISFGPCVLVLDEPTSALPRDEVQVLHGVVRRLAKEGRLGIIYVTHQFEEIPRVADTVTVLRDGKHIGTIPIDEAPPARIAEMMIGERWQEGGFKRDAKLGDIKLSVRNLSRDGVLDDISLDLRAGEVVGIAGLLGSGRTELVRAIFGVDAIDSGEIWVDGKPVTHPSPQTMKTHGVGMTPEDRQRQGLVPPFSVRKNLTLASLNRISSRGVLRMQSESQLSQKMVDSLSIKTSNLETEIRTLSGGNQQKVVIGNWLNTLPQVLLMDEPTRGIDIQAKQQIFTLVRDLARQGLAVLFVSSELEEVLVVADRILVMNRGRITREVAHDKVDLEQLLAMVMEELNNGSGNHGKGS